MAGPRTRHGPGRPGVPALRALPADAGGNRTDAMDHDTLLLQALAHIIADPALRDRFLALTGLDGAGLRARAGEPATLAAVEAFLAGHEPDLLAVAHALGVEPSALCGRS